MALDRYVRAGSHEINDGRSMNTAIAIFVKTPTHSPVKTRLAAGIGTEKAGWFYGLCLKAVRETVRNLDAVLFWAVAEETELNHPLWQDFARLYTGTGGLGERQYKIYDTLLSVFDRVLLIGADTPQLSSTLLEKAILMLESNDFVVGPARDGGYYLFGGRVALEKGIWTSVPWSMNMTRARLEAVLPAAPVHLAQLTDADTADDLSHVAGEMPSDPTDSQRRVIKWIQKNEYSVPVHG